MEAAVCVAKMDVSMVVIGDSTVPECLSSLRLCALGGHAKHTFDMTSSIQLDCHCTVYNLNLLHNWYQSLAVELARMVAHYRPTSTSLCCAGSADEESHSDRCLPKLWTEDSDDPLRADWGL